MSLRRIFTLSALLSLGISSLAATPGVSEHAPDFTLATPVGTSLPLSSLTSAGRVVLVVLRGYPGAQCPYSLQQFKDFQQSAALFAALNTQVLFIYPGASPGLAASASEFSPFKSLPDNFHLVIDPDFTVTNLYGLRWQADGETAYPATFIIEKDGSVYSSVIGKGHSDQTTAADTLVAISADNSAIKQP